MTKVERIEEWRGETVIDPQGEQLGRVDEVFYDARSGDALLLSVKSGKLRTKSWLVPLEGASVGRAYVRVAHGKATVEAADQMPAPDAIDAGTIDGIEATFGVKLPNDLELWSATEMEARRAEAQAAQAKAETLEREAEARIAHSEAARAQAQGAASDADTAAHAAEEARKAAAEARRTAQNYDAS